MFSLKKKFFFNIIFMKKTFFFFVAIFVFAASSFAQKGFEVNFSQPISSEYQLTFQLTDWNLANVVYDGVTYQQIQFSSSAVTIEKGWAELPFISASIQLPARKNVDLEVTYTEFTDYQLDFPLVPSRGTISRSQDPNTIPYQIAPESVMDKFYPGNLAYAEEPYIIRDVRGTSVRVFPFQYNSATNTLRVYTKMEVLLAENDEPATNPLLVENPNPIREVRGMYKSLFINYQEPRIPLWMADHGDILVITTSRDETAIQPYIDWKKEKGYNVEKEVVATGTNVKSLIQTKYAANNNLMYVLLVGGWNDIKSDLGSFGSLGSGPTDPILGDVTGTASQYRPDISIGRMSASSAAQVTTQVNKTIQYEKNPNMDAAWYSTFAGLGSNDGYGGDDGEKDHTHIINIYDYRLVPKYSYNQHKGFYDYNGTASASALATAINNGVSTIAYCGHGSENSFVTTGFNNNNINALNNGQKLPFIVSVACVNGAFHSQGGNCFAEVWLKKENGGAVITWMATINQPWNPPMRGQDYFYDVLTGGYNYTTQPGNGISTEELRTHWGAIAVNAANLMLNEATTSDDLATVRTWTTFGDPNLQLRTKQPAEIASSNNSLIPEMSYETTITAGGAPVKDALVCLSQDNVYVKGFTDESGNVSLEHPFTEGEVRLVVTAFNTTTIYETIPVEEMGDPIPPKNLSYEVENVNHVILNWEAPEAKDLTVKGYNVLRDNEQVNAELLTDETSFTDIAPANGEYKYEVIAVYGIALESDPCEPVTVTITGMCIPISSAITVTQTEGANILVVWNAPEYEGTELAGYNIYKDDVQINDEIIPADELTYLDENVETDIELCYHVEVIYNDCEEPLITEKECITLLSVKDLSGEQSFSIYPNPTSGELTINNGQLTIKNVEIYDVYGRKAWAKFPSIIPNAVRNLEFYGQQADGVVINISHLTNGIYFIKIDTEQGSVMKKLVKN